MKYNKNNDSGATMIEILGVLAIIGVLSVGGLAAYSTMMTKFKTTQIISQSQNLMKSLSTYFAAYRIYPLLTPSNIYKLGFLSDESYNSDTNTTKHPFGGSISFSIDEDGKKYGFSYDNLPVNVCVAMATMDINVANLYSITINSKTHTYPEPGTEYSATTNLPYDTGEAINDCSANPTIKWMFL